MSGKIKRQGGEAGMVRAAGLVSGLTLLSRILGLVREQAFAAFLGAGLYADAFQIAFRIPNLLRDLFAEGALSAAFVPTYARTVAEAGREAAHRLGSRLLTLLGVLLSGLVVVGIVFAEPLVRALAHGFAAVPGKIEVTVALTRVMLPFLPIVSFAAVAMGMLNAEERFRWPALAPAMFNVVAILWAVVLWRLGLSPSQVAMGWAIGTLLGGAAQFLIQVPELRQRGWRFRPEWAPFDPGIRAIGRLMGPATAGLAAVQVNIVVNSYFASDEPGAVAWLNFAFRILYLPIGLFGVALGTIATAGLAKRAAERDLDGLRNTLRRSLRLLAFLTFPATAGLLTLGVPIVRLLYERGRFTSADTQGTATALAYYALGLVAYTGVKVLAPAFYAVGRPRIPLIASLSAVGVNLLVNITLYRFLGFKSVALGTALGSLINAIVLLVGFDRVVGGLGGKAFFPDLARMAVLTTGMGGLAWLTATTLEAWLGTSGLMAQLGVGLPPVVLGAIVYGVGARLLRIPEALDIETAIRHRRSTV